MDCLTRRILPKDHLDDETVAKCRAAIQDEYHKRWADSTTAYPGIPELLSALQQRSIPRAVLSNKPDEFTRITIAKLLPEFSFNIVLGVKPSVPKKPDPTAALYIADKLGIPPNKFLFLGDTNTDMQTASSAGMFAVGALWGFRDADELLENGAKALVETPAEVLNLLDKNE